MTDLPILRTSERRKFKRCPQAWWWAYREGLKPHASRQPLWFGTGIHLALAEWYRPQGRGPRRGFRRGVHPVETWERFCKESVTEFVRTYPNETYDEQEYVEAQELGTAMLEAYLEEYGQDEHWEFIEEEQAGSVLIPGIINGKLVPSEPIVEYAFTFDGVLRDHRDDGRVKLLETKTAAQIITKHLTLDDQAGSYWAIADTQLHNDKKIKKSESLDGIIYNFLRKAKPDDRPRNADGYATNKPTKQHYLDQLGSAGIADATELKKLKVDELEELAAENGVTVLGEVSKNQPPPLFKREYVPRSPAERRTQIKRIATEADIMNRFRRKELPLYKNPTKDCSWDCEFFEMCELHEQQQDWEEYRDAMFRREDPYADHRREE